MGFKDRKASWVIVVLCLAFVSAFATFAASTSASTSFKVFPAADTYVASTSPNTAYGDAMTLWVSKSGDSQSWALISFNAASKLRPTDILVGARIKLIVDQGSGTFPAVLTAGQVLQGFSESTTTYNTRPATSFLVSSIVFFDKRPGPDKSVTIDVTKQLMAWDAGGRAGNFGIVLAMDPATRDAGIAFASRENADLRAPFLQIFTVPPGQTPYGYVLGPIENFAMQISVRE